MTFWNNLHIVAYSSNSSTLEYLQIFRLMPYIFYVAVSVLEESIASVFRVQTLLDYTASQSWRSQPKSSLPPESQIPETSRIVCRIITTTWPTGRYVLKPELLRWLARYVWPSHNVSKKPLRNIAPAVSFGTWKCTRNSALCPAFQGFQQRSRESHS